MTTNDDSHLSLPNTPPQTSGFFVVLNDSKNVHVLSQPSTGESTLFFLQKPPAYTGNDEPRTEFVVGYDWADVCDKGEEGRLSI